MHVNGTMVEEAQRLLQQYGQELVALDKTIKCRCLCMGLCQSSNVGTAKV